MEKKKVYVTLQNGKVFQGYRFGASGNVSGELIFSTSMVGYIEALTNPCNYGKILVQTFPLIGNYGMIAKDVESDKAWTTAYVVREICQTPSNFRCEGELDAYLKEQGVVGVFGIDTRELTKILREEGIMNARISSKKLKDDELKALATLSIENATQATAPTQQAVYGNENAEYTVALWNFGAKNSEINSLVEQGYRVISMPATATAEEILALDVDGVVISDGAGNPKDNGTAVEEIKKVLGKKPVFGVGLGHLLLALAFGCDTKKQKYGHCGANQPVKCLQAGKVYVSAQNHTYEVVKDSVKCGEVLFVNVNDGSCEGIDYPDYKAFSVQFAPVACSIGNPENPLYKKFFTLMKKEKDNA